MSTASTTFGSGCCGASSASPTDAGVWWRIAIGAFLAFNSMTVALAVNLSKVDTKERLVLQGIPLCVCLIVGLLLGGPMLSGVWREWRARRVTVESLFLLSSVGAFLASLVSYITGEGPVFFEVVSILFLVYALGRNWGGMVRKRFCRPSAGGTPRHSPAKSFKQTESAGRCRSLKFNPARGCASIPAQ